MNPGFEIVIIIAGAIVFVWYRNYLMWKTLPPSNIKRFTRFKIFNNKAKVEGPLEPGMIENIDS